MLITDHINKLEVIVTYNPPVEGASGGMFKSFKSKLFGKKSHLQFGSSGSAGLAFFQYQMRETRKKQDFHAVSWGFALGKGLLNSTDQPRRVTCNHVTCIDTPDSNGTSTDHGPISNGNRPQNDCIHTDINRVTKGGNPFPRWALSDRYPVAKSTSRPNDRPLMNHEADAVLESQAWSDGCLVIKLDAHEPVN
jgi:hypothetical protein